jgi:trans-aconitate 2-methyltransferase
MPSWNAEQYLTFADERTQPCRDLVSRIALEPKRIVDLGCGPGNSTAVLRRRWPQAEIVGIDSSPEMIAAARSDAPQGKWEQADISNWSSAQPFDLIFSNAALQWVTEHSRLYPHLLQQVSPGGALAVQVPANRHAPAHQRMRELADSAAWREHFPEKVREWHVHQPGDYFDWLSPLSRRVELWKTDYLHVMPGVSSIVDWYQGTGLRPFLDALQNEADCQRFMKAYEAMIAKDYPLRASGQVLFPFRRLFVIAYR